MKQHYNNPTASRKRDWIQISALVFLLALLALVFEARAQEGSQGNTTIFGGAQMTFFGNHDFRPPVGGTQPGVILTERATGNISYLNFFGNGLTSNGADDANYVDGYVRKYGTGQFIFPVGDSNAGTGYVGQFAASADGTSGAYFHANATSAVTSNLFTGTNYPALPAGGPFPTTTKSAEVATVSTVEYWDIDGATATPITLTWDLVSDVTTLTVSKLAYLTIVGWNGSQWVRIPSKYDVTSVLGGASSLTAGSITTTSAVVPDTYTAYTLAAVTAPDLTPFITISPNDITGSTAFNVRVRALNLNTTTGAPTTGAQITVRILKSTKWNVVYNPAAPSNPLGPLNPASWTYSTNPLYHIWRSTDIIPKGGSRYFGFSGTFTPGAETGDLPITVTIDYPSGGEIYNLNQTDVETVTFKP